MARPQLKDVLKSLENSALKGPVGIMEMRDALDRMTGNLPLPKGACISAVEANGVPCEWTETPGCSTQGALLYFHGGGYAMGSLITHRILVAKLSRAAKLRVLSVGYRLGPEEPFPAAVEDAVSAYEFLLDEGGAAEEIVIAGDSAGGGLAAACLLALREAGHPLPKAGALISPWLDLSLTRDSVTRLASIDPLVEAPLLQECADAYLGSTDPKTALASPLFADLSGLPPLLIQVGSAEILLDDATEFADSARRAGSEITLEVWEDMIHVWHSSAAVLPEARDAIAKIGSFLRQQLDGQP
ncbi:MAG: alpha/beta hydrolase [Deltaproteobacteria bacterium]|nr:alpha/beta hydrolase [Deltaproteobacteria bacterium]